MKNNLSIFEQRILLFSVFILSLCGITYELVLGSLATYLLGNPVQQYSITIGFFLSSMGLGSYLSRYILKDLIRNFIRIEVLLGFAGGLSVIVLNYLFTFSAAFYLLHIFTLVIIGTLVGLEIPLLTRILRRSGALKDILANVLTLDYMGGLAGSLFFPLLLFPFMGRILTCLVIGIINIVVALLVTVRIDYSGKRRSDFLMPIMGIIMLFVMAVNSGAITHFLEKKFYFDDVVFSSRSKFQEIVLTRNGNDFRLYLDGALQFSTFDEYRYHEMLIFPALDLCAAKEKRVLILGGGDGLAVKSCLTRSDVKNITLVELDPMMIDLAKNNSSLKRINGDALRDSRVMVVVGDAYNFLIKNRKTFDVIIADFPDPHDEIISKLYTVQFFSLIRRSLHGEGIFVSQSTSPLFAREAFWCIHNTMKEIFPRVVPYHVFIPTFGDWGYNMAFRGGGENFLQIKNKKRKGVGKFYRPSTFTAAQHFPPDMDRVKTAINTFNKPVVYSYYIKGWRNVDY